MQNFLSIYVHWPFCLSKCPYCDFNSHVTSQVDHVAWLKSYELELDYFAGYLRGKYIRSIFFGGGTPSLMEPFVVEGVINKIAQLGTIDDYTEVTLETNPTSFETDKFKAFRSAGINRVSIGVQSLIAADLKKLGRQHDVEQAIKTIETARKLFPRISFDLIYAREGQTLEAWQEELAAAMKLASGHISLYQLTIEKGTPFYKLFQEGNLILPNSDQAADMYEWTNNYLESHDYLRYEISNYSIANHESRHNLAYWYYDNYLGIGPGAHSRITTNNTTSMMMWHRPEKWLQSVADQGHGIQSKTKLSQEQVSEEIIMMGLRLKNGIKIEELEKKTGLPLSSVLNMPVVEYYQSLGLIVLTKDHIFFTDKGLMLHSYLVPRLLTKTKILIGPNI